MMNSVMIESPYDSILQEDLEYIANSNIPLEELKNHTIFITGATGLIGSQIVKALVCCNRLKGANIKIIALARNDQKVQALFGNLLNHKNLKIVYGDVLSPFTIDENIDYIIHGASITASKEFVIYPVETIKTTLEGTRNILELGKEKKIKGLVYLSSLEVYGVINSMLQNVSENDYGYIDVLDTRSSYPESKRMAECMCVSYAKQYNMPIKIARLTQTFGAGVEYEDNRVFAQFARSVIEEKDIILHTLGDTVRNYCYIKDAIIALFFILIKGKKGEAYNVANRETAISIKDMAQMIIEEFSDSKIKVRFEMEKDTSKFGYNPTTKINLDTDKIEALGWKPSVDLIEMYSRMIKSMLNIKESNLNTI